MNAISPAWLERGNGVGEAGSEDSREGVTDEHLEPADEGLGDTDEEHWV